MPAGKVYDTDEVSRIQGWLDMQENDFKNTENELQRKNAIVSTVIIVVAGVLAVFVARKILKK